MKHSKNKNSSISPLHALNKSLGSLYFAVFLIAALAVILIISTSLESIYGTPFAQKVFYNAGWFDLFLGLLGVNIFCSAISRYPFKKKHTGFLLTHAGILILLAGSLMSRLWGVDGQMSLYESEKKDTIIENTYELVLHDPAHEVHRFDLMTRAGQAKRKLYRLPGTSADIYLNRVWNNALLKTDISDSAEAPANHAVKLTLSSQMAGQKETFWLVENNPLDENSSSLSMGPATVRLLEKPRFEASADTEETPKTPLLRITQKDSGQETVIDLEKNTASEIPFGQSGLKIKNLLYYPDARVGENNKLVSVSDKPQNPAAEFEVHDAAGNKERYAAFALFPEFESMHEKAAKKSFGLSVKLTAPSDAPQKKGPSLTIHYTPEGEWSYAAVSSKSKTGGAIKAGETYTTGWMDFSFQVDKILNRAVVSEHVEENEPGAKGLMAAELSLVENGKTLVKNWVLEDSAQSLDGPTGQVIVAMRRKTAPVPFTLELKDFRKVDYPGSQQAQSYESDVVLTDPKENITIGKTIKMNKPLDYAGYRIFQSSYFQDPNSGEGSVFTVAKNPGIALIYSGSIIIFLGIFLVFFVAPFSSLIKEG